MTRIADDLVNLITSRAPSSSPYLIRIGERGMTTTATKTTMDGTQVEGSFIVYVLKCTWAYNDDTAKVRAN